MTKILVAGVGPIPFENPPRLFAPGLRTWLLAETLARAGHGVSIAAAQFAETERSAVRFWRIERAPRASAFEPQLDGEIKAVSLAEALRRAAGECGAEALVATTDVMGEAAVRANLPLPLWIDFNGAPMPERQLLAAMADSDGGLAAAWRTILPCLLSGDRFSTCSESQRLAVIGELGACGRLNRFTAAAPLVHAMMPGPAFSEFRKTQTVLRGAAAPEDAFLVLWSGGFNTWTDVETLHSGLVEAMRRAPAVHFVSTGGAIPGHCETVYPRFERLVAEGPFCERFHLLGWVDLETVQNLYLECDLAINIDRFSHEGLLGHRNRMLDWLRARLPIATTELCDLSRILVRRGLAYGFPIGGAQALGAVIAEAASDPAGRRQKAESAYELLETEFRNETLLAPLLRWAERPERSPDLQTSAHPRTDGPFPYPSNTLAQAQFALLERSAGIDEIEALRRRCALQGAALARLRGSRLVRLFAKIKGYSLEDES